ncbi:MAG: thioredoxin family protein [bacterium]|nr:thioredoxin family protein [bacterium]
MKKKLLAGILVLIIAAAGFLILNNDKPMQNNAASNLSPTDTPINSINNEQMGAGSYREYSEEALAEASGSKLLFFHAPWCPQCRALEQDIQSKGVPEGQTIFKVDYDSNQALRQKYGVTIQTTFVLVNDQGELSKKFVAYDDPTLQSVQNNIFSR